MAFNNLSGKDPLVSAVHQFGTVEFFRSGAYCNLGDIAKTFGKRVEDWRRLRGTKKLIEAFEKDPSYNGAPAIVVVRGQVSGAKSDHADPPKPYWLRGLDTGHGGTWAHPDIAIQFAQWCSPEFALWVSRQVRHLLTYGEVNVHYREWTKDQYLAGVSFNRDDISDLYGKKK